MALHTTMLEDLKRAAWARTSPVQAQMNSWEFRKDCLGNLIRYADFGNRHSPFGWELECIVARAGGNTDPDNMQALHWKANARAGQQYAEPRLQTVAEAEAARRTRVS